VLLGADDGSVLVFAPQQPAVRLALNVYLSALPCGFPSPAEDHVRSRLDLNDFVVKHPSATFYVRAVGHSMRPAIHSGDLLVVDRAVPHSPGRVVVAVVRGEFTVKRLVLAAGSLRLVSDNDTYPPVDLGDGAEVTIWGVVTHVVHQP
jgi:DNA polymerase V